MIDVFLGRQQPYTSTVKHRTKAPMETFRFTVLPAQAEGRKNNRHMRQHVQHENGIQTRL